MWGVSLSRARSFFAPIYFLAPATQATMTSTKIRLLYFKAQQRLKQICIEKIMYDRLKQFLYKHNIFYNYQYGFRERCSTEHAI